MACSSCLGYQPHTKAAALQIFERHGIDTGVQSGSSLQRFLRMLRPRSYSSDGGEDDTQTWAQSMCASVWGGPSGTGVPVEDDTDATEVQEFGPGQRR